MVSSRTLTTLHEETIDLLHSTIYLEEELQPGMYRVRLKTDSTFMSDDNLNIDDGWFYFAIDGGPPPADMGARHRVPWLKRPQ